LQSNTGGAAFSTREPDLIWLKRRKPPRPLEKRLQPKMTAPQFVTAVLSFVLQQVLNFVAWQH
jgi:hypothetical protein